MRRGGTPTLLAASERANVSHDKRWENCLSDYVIYVMWYVIINQYLHITIAASAIVHSWNSIWQFQICMPFSIFSVVGNKKLTKYCKESYILITVLGALSCTHNAIISSNVEKI
jgi:hypothetical protein